MRRIAAAAMVACGLLPLVAEAVLAQVFPPGPSAPPGPSTPPSPRPSPAQIANRLACNSLPEGFSRRDCIGRVCGTVAPALRGACQTGSGPFAAAAAPPQPPRPPVAAPLPPTPAQIQARRACNARPPAQWSACINAVCGPVAPQFQQACRAGTGSFAGAGPPTPAQVAARRACNARPPAQWSACINAVCGPVAPQFQQACWAGTGSFAGAGPPTPAQVAARWACNARPPVQWSACINAVCGPVAPQFQQACRAGTGPFAGAGPPTPAQVAARRACSGTNVPVLDRCISSTCARVPPAFRDACRLGTGPFAGASSLPTPAQAAARRACSGTNVPVLDRCISSTCARVPPAFRDACRFGTGPFAGASSLPTPAQVAARRACNAKPLQERSRCADLACRSPIEFRKFCLSGTGPYSAGPRN